MRENIQQKRTKQKPRESLYNYNRPVNTYDDSSNIEEINRLGLIFQLMAPKFINRRDNNLNQIKDKVSSIPEISYTPLFQALSMDLTSYQTLNQLIIENKNLVGQSQSAYFLSRQSQKLIHFIDGWSQLQKGSYREQDFELMEFKQESQQKSVRRQRSKQKGKSEALYEQDEQQKLKRVLKDKNNLRLEGQQELRRISSKMQNKRQVNRLSVKPALIVQDQPREEHKSINNINIDNMNINNMNINSMSNSDQIQIQANQNQQGPDQNDMNSSNIMISKFHKQVQKGNNIKIFQKQQDLNKKKVIKIHMNKNQKSTKDAQRVQLSQIIRPQYQKRQISTSQREQSLIQSGQTVQEVITQPMNKKKTVIPLLKKDKQLSARYNQHVKAIAKHRQVQVSVKQTASHKQQQQAINQEKGFISEDTDANSRLSMLNNNRNRFSNRQGSLSPKVQGKRQPKIANINNREQIHQMENAVKFEKGPEQMNDDQQKYKSRGDSQERQRRNKNLSKYDKLYLQSQIAELEEEFMNRRKSIQKKDQQPRPNTQMQEQVQSRRQRQDQQSEELYLTKPPPKQIKALKLIKRSSVQPSGSQRKPMQNGQMNQPPQTHYPFMNNVRNMLQQKQKNSVVMEQQPWQCEQLQLEQQLKALDQKIQGRKSILAVRQQQQMAGQRLYQQQPSGIQEKQFLISHQRTSSTYYQQYNSSQAQRPNNLFQAQRLDSNRHKRSRTTNTNIMTQKQGENYMCQHQGYNQHLFEDNGNNEENAEGNTNRPSNQPKVVRLSLAALAKNISTKSRLSGARNQCNNQKGMQRKPSHTRIKEPRGQRNSSVRNLQKDRSKCNLNKQASCKSILLYQQAQKRGISPCKSTRSSNPNPKQKTVSPIKQYTSSNNHSYNNQQTMINQNRTPRNNQSSRSPINGRQNQRQPYSQGQKQNFFKAVGDRFNRFPVCKDDGNLKVRHRNDERQLRNLSPINHDHQVQQNTVIQYDIDSSHTPKSFYSNSRITEIVDSEYSRAKKKNALTNHQNKQINYRLQQQHFYADSYENGQNPGNSDHSMYSNCEKYLNAVQNNDNRNNQQYQRGTNQPVKKWNIPQSKDSRINQYQVKRKKIVLLSDQLGD